jgi:hypothetical protein
VFWFIPSIGVADGVIFERGGGERGEETPRGYQNGPPYANAVGEAAKRTRDQRGDGQSAA